MINQLKYKGYTASIFFTEEDGVFFGKVEGIKDLISFEGDSVKFLTEDFHSAIDEYLEFCESTGKEPQKSSGHEDITPEKLYNIVYLYANQKKMPINVFVENFIKSAEPALK